MITRLNNIQSLIDLEKYRGRFFNGFPTKWFDKLFIETIRENRGVFNNINCALKIQKTDTLDTIDKSQYLSSIILDSNVGENNYNSMINLFENRDPELYYDKSPNLCNSTFSSPYRYDGNLLKKAHAKAIQEKYFDDILDF